jgi:hypothetical protein
MIWMFFISIIMFGICGSNVWGAESFIILSRERARIGVAHPLSQSIHK